MGANQFRNRVSATTSPAAFEKAVTAARYEHGHGGYTGTIAEKSSFKMVTPDEGESPAECLERLTDDPDHWSDDKWGPAACICMGPNEKKPGERWFVFFGWASS